MSEDPLIGQVLAERYRIDALVGEGAMGRVYSAEHVLMRKRVAVKVLHRELTRVPEIVQRFEREAMAAAHIDHPHVASATDFGKLSDGSVYLVLEFVEGKPLSALIQEGPIPVSRALGISIQIAAGLQAAHAADIVHRDLKPDNILLVAQEDESDWVKVLDFGIAKVPNEATSDGRPITQVGVVYGTPEYMAPEQALGQTVDARADLYSLGVILYEMLSGQRPYGGSSVGLLGQQLSKPIPRISDRTKGLRVPPNVEDFVRKLLTTDLHGRPASAEVVLRELEVLEAEVGEIEARARRSALSTMEEITGRIELAAQPIGRAVTSRRGRGAFLALLFGAVGVVVAIVVIGTVNLRPRDRPAELVEPPPPLEVVQDDQGVDLEAAIDDALAQGVPALRRMAQEHPAEGRVHAALALALAKEQAYPEAVEAARAALALDPKLNDSPMISEALLRAAQSTTATSAAFRLLEGAMGSAGADIIYDLNRAPKVKPWVKRQSTLFLESEDVREVASPGLLLVLDLSRDQECESVARLVERAALVGDKRALPLLKNLETTTGCGPGNREDCYPCLRETDRLAVAIATIDKRATLTDGSPEEGTSEVSEQRIAP